MEFESIGQINSGSRLLLPDFIIKAIDEAVYRVSRAKLCSLQTSMKMTTMSHLQWLIREPVQCTATSQHENRLSLNYSSINPAMTMVVNVIVVFRCRWSS